MKNNKIKLTPAQEREFKKLKNSGGYAVIDRSKRRLYNIFNELKKKGLVEIKAGYGNLNHSFEVEIDEKYFDKLKYKVYNFPTKNEHGFTKDEMNQLLKEFPNINMEKFNQAMMGNTCMVIDDEIINYHIDVLTALRCGIENRDMHFHEWD